MKYYLDIEEVEYKRTGLIGLAFCLFVISLVQLLFLGSKTGFATIFNMIKMEFFLFFTVLLFGFSIYLIYSLLDSQKELKNKIHPILNVERDFIELNHGLVHERVYFQDVEKIEVVKKTGSDDTYVLRLKDQQIFRIYTGFPAKEVIAEIKHYSNLEEEFVKEIKTTN